MLTLLTSAALVAAVFATSAPCRLMSAYGRYRGLRRVAQPSVNLFLGLAEEFDLQSAAANDNRRPRRRAVAGAVSWLREVERA